MAATKRTGEPKPADDAVEVIVESLLPPDPPSAMVLGAPLADSGSFGRGLNQATLTLAQTADRVINGLHGLRNRDHEVDIELKKSIGRFARRAAGVQLIAANAVVIAYVIWALAKGLDISVQIISVWFSVVVVEVIGVLFVVSNYIFPKRGSSWSEESSEIIVEAMKLLRQTDSPTPSNVAAPTADPPGEYPQPVEDPVTTVRPNRKRQSAHLSATRHASRRHS